MHAACSSCPKTANTYFPTRTADIVVVLHSLSLLSPFLISLPLSLSPSLSYFLPFSSFLPLSHLSPSLPFSLSLVLSPFLILSPPLSSLSLSLISLSLSSFLQKHKEQTVRFDDDIRKIGQCTYIVIYYNTPRLCNDTLTIYGIVVVIVGIGTTKGRILVVGTFSKETDSLTLYVDDHQCSIILTPTQMVCVCV